MKKSLLSFVCSASLLAASGCGYLADLYPGNHLTGENLIMKRSLVATGKISVYGKSSQQIADMLGQPNEVRTNPRENTSEWDYIYYKPMLNEVTGTKKLFTLKFTGNNVHGVEPEPAAVDKSKFWLGSSWFGRKKTGLETSAAPSPVQAASL